MEAPRSFNTELVPPVRPSSLITLEACHLGECFCLGSHVHHTSSWQLVLRQDWSECGSELEPVVSVISGEHLLLIHQLLIELLKLHEHLRHLFIRHTERLSNHRDSRTLNSPIWRSSQRKATQQQPKPQELNTAAPLPCRNNMGVARCPACSCCLSETKACDDGRLMCTCPSSQITLKIMHKSTSLCTTVNVFEVSLRSEICTFALLTILVKRSKFYSFQLQDIDALCCFFLSLPACVRIG